jgi:Protein of unknown function (DUF616)
MPDIECYYLGNIFFFKLKGAAEVYCGFFCEKGGFRISDVDKNYMRKCKAVVSTCAFGGGDDLYQPIGMTDTSLQNVIFFQQYVKNSIASGSENLYLHRSYSFVLKGPLLELNYDI